MKIANDMMRDVESYKYETFEEFFPAPKQKRKDFFMAAPLKPGEFKGKSQYKVGGVVAKGGKKWRILTLAPDGQPETVEEVK